MKCVVSGEYPGPGLWKVTRADDPSGHVMWIVGEPPPLPKRMKWKSKDIEAVALGAQEILLDSAVRMDADEKIGFFRGVTLMPAMLEARRNPDDAKLKDLVPAQMYAALARAEKALPRAVKAASRAGVRCLRRTSCARPHSRTSSCGRRRRWDVIGKLAEEHKIKVTTPLLRYTFKRSEVRTKLKEFSKESLPDVECLGTMLALTEALADRETQSERAHAWAVGDHEALARLPALPSPYLPCAMAVLSSQVAREVVPADIREQVHALWLQAAEKALAANPTTFAVAPFVKLTRPGGYLEMLRAKGYLIEAPP